ncbi:hypothetical protein Bca4012_090952 [Brassica carinata]|uniref:Uncharacterized protein n=1 Tax=Brassica carinata TaxID=52824 RepID=A0A8X7P4Z6_BRACI|nr:hypothetical protein Bca52824_085722 [Brassica carinata]
MGISISPKSSNPGVKFLHLVTESIPFYNVMRGGRTVKISIYDVVVGDVIPLRIGDQVRLNGLATFIGIVGLTVALVVLVALLVSLYCHEKMNMFTRFIVLITMSPDSFPPLQLTLK